MPDARGSPCRVSNPTARAAGKALIAEGKLARQKRTTLIFVNNRLEGNALETIQAMVEAD
jgi:hypothetical protein